MPAPLTLRLPFSLMDVGFYFYAAIMKGARVSLREAREIGPAFEVSEPERRFVKTLLQEKRNLWLYRCHQRYFCGDFIVVDMSSNDLDARRVVVLELKERHPVRSGPVGTGQTRFADAALAELVADQVISGASQLQFVVGGSHEMVAWFEAWPAAWNDGRQEFA